ncbi:MAG: DUF3617 domain-containing protein [Rhizobacter sp.]
MSRFQVAVIWLLLSISGSAPVQAAEVGEQWEYSGTMDMMGMKMPMPPSRVCTKAGTEATPTADMRCKVSDVKTAASKTSYRVSCPPPDAMEGSGEAERKGDTVVSTFRMKSKDGEMHMSMTGRKLGPCTPTVN